MAKVIAEIGINHNGDMKIAKKLVAMAKEAGADAVKFQMRDVDTVYAGELENPRQSPWGTTQGEQKRGLEFSTDQYLDIWAFCEIIDIPWFASCWDMSTAHRAHSVFTWNYNKVASAMVTNHDFCKLLASGKRYTFVSTGGCTMQEIKDCIDIFRAAGCRVCVMHCVSQYPCPDNDLNLNMLHTLREAFPYCDIGYSGHEVGLSPSIMAIAMGAKWVERHITLDRSMYGSDQAASMEFHGLSQLCKVAHSAEEILGDGVKRILPGEADCMRKLRYWVK